MKIKTSELTDTALDWAVEVAEEMTVSQREFQPSTNWAHGGPIIEREGIRLHRSHTGAWWAGSEADPQRPIEGPTPLVAAMRCYVASQLGDEVEVPEELQ